MGARRYKGALTALLPQHPISQGHINPWVKNMPLDQPSSRHPCTALAAWPIDYTLLKCVPNNKQGLALKFLPEHLRGPPILCE